jgi:hypothetical protein
MLQNTMKRLLRSVAAAAAAATRRLDGGAAQEQLEASYRDYLQVRPGGLLE